MPSLHNATATKCLSDMGREKHITKEDFCKQCCDALDQTELFSMEMRSAQNTVTRFWVHVVLHLKLFE